jgi:hypothetical protein
MQDYAPWRSGSIDATFSSGNAALPTQIDLM